MAPETKALLDAMKARLGADLKAITHAAVAWFSEQPLYWQRRAIGQISEAEYLALQAAAAVEAARAQKGKR